MGKVMGGNRAVVKIDGVVVGLFDSISYGAALATEGIFTLGRDSANEVAVLGYELVNIQCSGFRVVDQGVHILPKFPKLQDIIGLGTVQLEVKDRQTGINTAIIEDCVPAAWNEQNQAKSTTRFNVNYIGTVLSDESGGQTESSGATSLP